MYQAACFLFSGGVFRKRDGKRVRRASLLSRRRMTVRLASRGERVSRHRRWLGDREKSGRISVASRVDAASDAEFRGDARAGEPPNAFAGTYVSSGGRGGDRGGRDEGLATPRGGGQEHAVALDEFHDGLLLRLVQLHVLRLRGPIQDALEHRLRAVVLQRHHRAGQRPGLDPRVIDGLLLLGQLDVGGCARDEARATRDTGRRGRVPGRATEATVSTHASRGPRGDDRRSRGDRAHPPSRRVFSAVTTTRAEEKSVVPFVSSDCGSIARFYFSRGADILLAKNGVDIGRIRGTYRRSSLTK